MEDKQSYIIDLSKSPSYVVNDGKFDFKTFDSIPSEINLLDTNTLYHYKLPTWFKNCSLKEWRRFCLADKRWFVVVSIYDLKKYEIIRLSAWDRQNKKFYESKKIVFSNRIGIHNRIDGDITRFYSQDFSLRFEFDLQAGEMKIDSYAKKGRRSGFKASFTTMYNARQAATNSICIPLIYDCAMYSTKILMPMKGFFRTNEEDYNFNSSESIALFEDTKAFLPYKSTAKSVLGLGLDQKGRRIAFYLCDSSLYSNESENENILCINSRVFSLPAVKITMPNGLDKTWNIQDMEGLVDLSFIPERNCELRMNLIITNIRYETPFGSFSGILRSPDGSEKIDVKDLYGIGESKLTRA